MSARSWTRRLVLCGIVGVFGASLAAGPAGARVQMEGGLHLAGAFPMGDFKDEIEDPGAGLGLSFFARIQNSPVLIGGDFSYFIYGNSERTEPFNPSIPEVRVRVSTSNNIVQGGLVLRLQPPSGAVQPYLDGMIGFNYLFTESAVKYKNSEEEIASDTNFDDTALCVGGGGGLMIRVYENRAENAGVRGVLIDLRGRYLAGGEAEYLKEGSITRQNGQIVYETIESKTDLVQAGVGVTLQF